MNELKQLITSGRGSVDIANTHHSFGKELWQYNTGTHQVFIFEKGLSYLSGSTVVSDFFFSSITEIKSFLTAAVLSSASTCSGINMMIPMQLVTSDEIIQLEIPLVVYSRLLGILQKLRVGLNAVRPSPK
jgi:hypothetical protein